MDSEAKVVSVAKLLPRRGFKLGPCTRGRKKLPHKRYYIRRRYDENRRFAEYFGPHVLEVLKKKGFLKMKKANKEKRPIVKNEEGKTVVNPTVTSITQSSYDVLETIVKSLERGDVVPGFALIPSSKVAGNGTVKSVLIEKFMPGRPAYGCSLCEVKQ